MQHPQPSVEFIRLFFKSPLEEEFAVRFAEFTAKIVGERVLLLRPDTTISEIFQWVGPDPLEAALFVHALRNEFVAVRKEFGLFSKELTDNAEFMTFREFVEYVCSQQAAQDGGEL